MRKEAVPFALGALVAIGALGAGMALRNDGLEFPDGSLQTTAPALPASTAVQGSAVATIPNLEFCSPDQTLYTVPAGKRLAIEWVSVRLRSFSNSDPVDVDITTRQGASPIFHQLVRLDGSQQLVGSLFTTNVWSSSVRLYSDAGQNVEFGHCRSGDPDEEHVATMTFSGHLVDVP